MKHFLAAWRPQNPKFPLLSQRWWEGEDRGLVSERLTNVVSCFSSLPVFTCSNSTIEIPEQYVKNLFKKLDAVVSLSLTLSIFHILFCCFHCLPETNKSRFRLVRKLLFTCFVAVPPSKQSFYISEPKATNSLSS